ncbi:DUF4465 domain-containing protein [Halosquirtibacter xylanolyticus]|uniref:DUF4465 domain-containing protein n=1 Tax=Halosquirtibacter xylanolyticus TaxID=3374599 RepID=UPI0037481F27|nr:DUF4465 domain-containing protein [Prolixibacteraceae bacterium]
MKKNLLLLLTLLSISLSSYAQEYLESFEDPNCLTQNNWTLIHGGGDSQWEIDSNGHTGDHAISINSSRVTNDDFLVCPLVEVKEGSTFSFWAKSQYSFSKESFTVYITEASPSRSNFKTILEEVNAVPQNYQEYTYSLDSYIGKQVYLTIHATSANNYKLFIDDVTLPQKHIPKVAPNTPELTLPVHEQTEIDITTELKWNKVPFTGNYLVSLGTTTEANNIFDNKEVTASQLKIKDLDYNQQYYWKVTAKNSYGSSPESTTLTFTTMDDPTVTLFPWKEAFESKKFPPLGWRTINIDKDAKQWIRNLFSGVSNSKCASINGYSLSDDWLISPPLQLPNSALLKYAAKTYGSQIEVAISTSGNEPEEFEIIHTQKTTGTYQDYLLDLSKYQGQRVFIAFHHKANQALDLDDISIKTGTPVQLNEINYSSPVNSSMARGSIDQLLTRIDLDLTGEVGTVPLETLQLKVTPNKAVKKLKIFHTRSDQFKDQTLWKEHIITEDNQQQITFDQQLEKGKNYLWVTADIHQELAFGTEIQAIPFSVEVDKTEYLFENNASYKARQVMNMVHLTSGNKIISVDKSLSFFDDGGVDQNYSENFEGTVTFQPKHKEKIIAIEFNQFDIFNTSSTGKNDLFEVYKGASKDPKNLIGTYSKMPPIIESESLGGALTIYFKVKTSLPRSGWEATVKEVTAQTMTVASIKGIAPENKLFKPADNNVLLTGIHVITSHTASPLHLTSIPFKLADNKVLDNISRLYLVTSGVKKSPLNIAPISTIELTSQTGQIDVDIPLSSGDNYFWILADIKPTAKNNEKFSLSLTELNFRTIQSPLTLHEEFDISTDFTMPESGSHTVNVGTESIRFTDSGKDKKHKADDNTTVTFVPKNAGEKVRISFKDFDLNYSSSAYYGTKSVFVIYDGATKTTPLFTLSSLNRTTGPEKAITSTSDDGSLTVHFIAKTRSSSYTKEGWDAIVQSVKDEPIHAEKVIQHNLNPTQIGIGQESMPVVKALVKTTGLKSNPASGNITWNLNYDVSTLKNIKKVHLYYLANRDNFEEATLIHSYTTDHIETFQSNQELAEGNNYFWFTFDIDSSAEDNQPLHVKIDQVTIASESIGIEGNDNFAQTILKRFINFSSTIDTYTVGEKPTQFFDDGGETGNYSQALDHQITFIPEQESQSVRVDWNEIDLDDYGFDKIKVYNGKNATEEDLLSTYESKVNTPHIDKAMNKDGALTIHFKSTTYATPKSGWRAIVKTYTPTPITFHSAQTTPAPNRFVKKGEENYVVLHSALNFRGEKDTETITDVTGNIGNTTTSTDIVKSKLWASHNQPDLSQAKLIGESTIDSNTGEFHFDTNIDIDRESDIHLWLTYDLAATAEIGHHIDANFTEVGLKSSTITPTAHTAQINTIESGMHGNYTVGNLGDYNTLNEALNALKTKGIDGATTFNIKEGKYSEVITIPSIQGASKINTLLIQSEAEDATKVTFINETASEDIKSLFIVHHSKYVTIKHLSFESSNTALDQLVLIDDNSQHITFDNCRFKAPIATSYRNDINLLKTKAEDVANKNNDHLQFTSNHFEGGYIALNIGGTGYVRLPKQRDCLIEKNHFLNQGSKSIYCNNQVDVIIKSNHIENTKSTKSGFQGMDIYRAKGQVVIFNNTVDLQLDKNGYGFEVRESEGTIESPILVYNNMIAINAKTGKSYGMNITRQSRYIDIAYNTVNIYGTNDSGVGIGSIGRREGDYPLAQTYRYNNIISLIGQSMSFKKIVTADQVQVVKNNLNASNGVQIGDDKYEEITAINNLTAFTGNIKSPAAFISETDLHLTHQTELNRGEVVDYILTDIDGDKRTVPYTLGADQFIEISQTAPVIREGYPKVISESHNELTVEIVSDKAGTAYGYIYQDKTASLTPEQIMAQATTNASIFTKGLAANKTSQIVVEKLKPNTNYIIDVVVVDLQNKASELKQIEAHTPYAPTSIADFENISMQDDKIISGTVEATNVTIKEESKGTHGHIAEVEANETAHFLFNNTDKGITVQGFYIQSNASTIMTIYSGTTPTIVTIPSTEEKWSYISLLEYDNITAFDIEAQTTKLSIDDIHQSPAPLTVEEITTSRITKGEVAHVTVNVSGGHTPYTVEYNGIAQTNRTGLFEYDLTLDNSNEIFFTVKDQEKTTAVTSCIIEVTAPLGTMDFESFDLKENDFWRGRMINGVVDTKLFESGFGAKSYFNKAYFTWTGLNVSNKIDKEVAGGLMNQHTAITGVGADNSTNYGVIYAFSKEAIEVSGQPEGAVITGMYVTNNTYAVTSMKQGDAIAKKFGGADGTDQDWFKLVAIGYDSQNNKTGETEFYLADFRSNISSKDYIVESWEWMDLSTLGKVNRIEFKMISSDVNKVGQANTPAYFCFDNFNGSSPSDQGPILKKELPSILFKTDQYILDLKEYFEDPDGDNLSFEIENLDRSITYEIDNGILTLRKSVKSTTPSLFNIIAKSLQKHISVPVNIELTTGISSRDIATTVKIGPNPTRDYLYIESTSMIDKVQVFNLHGQSLLHKEPNKDKDQIDFSTWERGVYIIFVHHGRKTFKQKVVLN